MKSFTQTMAVGSKPESAAGERARVDVRMVVELVDRPEDAGARGRPDAARVVEDTRNRGR